MVLKQYIQLFVVLISVTSCYNNHVEPTFSLQKSHDSLYYIQLKTDSTFDQWELPYPVYQFCTGDIDENQMDEVVVGVIKPTRFDSVSRKRLFIFKNYHGHIRPLWLGSRLGKPLVDFNFVHSHNEPRIRTLEQLNHSTYLIAEYKWQRFGLTFTEYVKQDLSYDSAIFYLKNN
ncbi:hypothetical protein [Crocinitomix algicola]|uniref:hypothetical protein n=1 Tax=Crocinitomix algicola TaxID=1740263 RepID=UPI000872C832|nr:hypothetical protein [Crocinitomix algicola]